MSDSPVLLTGHLLFLGGLCLLAWLSWPRETRLFFLGWRMSPLVLTSLIGGWSLLGVALTELAATDSLNGRLEVSDWSWLAGGAAFASGLMLTGYCTWVMLPAPICRLISLPATIVLKGMKY